MTDYDDQNSSEYKDQTTETTSAEQTGQQISSPADEQDTNQQVPDNRQMPPQNNGQDPYWQNPNNQQVPPQNSGQNPYWQNPNNQQIPPQNNGRNPYWQNPNNLLRTTGRILTGRTKTTSRFLLSITGSRPTGRISRSAQDARKTHLQRCP